MTEAVPEIYPFHAFERSQTWRDWVRLPISWIHASRRSSEYYPGCFPWPKHHKPCTNVKAVPDAVFFYLNHPIRWVCVAGPVVAFADLYTKHTLFYVDDGSGSNIAVKLRRLLPEDVTPQAPSNTTVSNVNILSSLGQSSIEIDGVSLDIGTVVKIKCTIEVFRDSKQLVLQRAWVLKSTTEEAIEWQKLMEWTSKLSTPWILPAEELHSIEKKLAREKLDKEKRQQKRLAIAKTRDSHRQTQLQKWEKERQALEIEMNTGALI
jgi:Telomere regulation protein Stn1